MAGTSDKPLLVVETDDKVVISINSYTELKLPPASARFLARKLNRIALRIEKRTASGTLTEGGDVEQAPGDSLSGPTGEAGDAQ